MVNKPELALESRIRYLFLENWSVGGEGGGGGGSGLKTHSSIGS